MKKKFMLLMLTAMAITANIGAQWYKHPVKSAQQYYQKKKEELGRALMTAPVPPAIPAVKNGAIDVRPGISAVKKGAIDVRPERPVCTVEKCYYEPAPKVLEALETSPPFIPESITPRLVGPQKTRAFPKGRRLPTSVHPSDVRFRR